MVLRFITFVILIIIVWIYADLVHAKANGISVNGGTCSFITFQEYTTLTAERGFLFFDNILSGLQDKGVDTSSIPSGTFIGSYSDLVNSQTYITDTFLNELPIPTNVSGTDIDANGKRWNIDNLNVNDNGVYLYLDTANENHFTYYVIFTNKSEQWIYGYRNAVYNYENDYDWSNINAFKFGVTVDYDVINDSWSATVWGSRYDESQVICPLFSNDIVWYAYNGVNGVVNSDFTEVTTPVTSQVLDLNYVNYNNMIGSGTPKESNINHLYFEDVQIGLTGQASNQDITSAEVVVGVSVDDWVLNHINDFYVNIAYNVHMKDSLTGTPDPDFTIHKIVPLKAFMNDGYVYSIYDLFQEGNFISYYNNIRSTYSASVVSTDGWIHSNAIVPTLLRNASYVFTDYFVRTVESQQANYSIFDFGLDVTVQLSAGALGGTGNMSYPYTKAFDFLNGSSSITSAEGLRNHNPWLGETTPQANPLVPQGGSDIIGGGGSYGGGNTNVSVNVSGQKIPMNVQTKQEMNDTLTNYTNAFTTFTQSIRSLADMESQNNFYAVLSNTVPMIPGVNIFLQYVALTCGVMLILLVLKILLF